MESLFVTFALSPGLTARRSSEDEFLDATADPIEEKQPDPAPKSSPKAQHARPESGKRGKKCAFAFCLLMMLDSGRSPRDGREGKEGGREGKEGGREQRDNRDSRGESRWQPRRGGGGGGRGGSSFGQRDHHVVTAGKTRILLMCNLKGMRVWLPVVCLLWSSSAARSQLCR